MGNMNNLEIINRLRQVSLDQFHKGLDVLQQQDQLQYYYVTLFLTNLQPEPKFERKP